MEFNQPKGIYLQIADQICDRILQGEWNGGDRIPSIRELAVDLGVNPNTVTRSYQSLLDRQIIDNRRGIGYFVSDAARSTILKERREEFIREDLPGMFRAMKLLDIGIEEISSYYANFAKEGNEDEST